MAQDPQYHNLLTMHPWLAELPPSVKEKLCRLLELLLEYNKKFNLTAIRDPKQVVISHFADSLAPLHLLPWFQMVQKAADIGSGAGFPILPLAACMSQCTWFGIESTAKKAGFIELVARELELGNVQVFTLRAETFAHSLHRGSFDVVTARAVGSMSALCEIGLPLLRKGGRLVLFKTEASLAHEVPSIEPVLKLLGGKLLDSVSYAFDGDRQRRILFVIERAGEIPEKYPRKHKNPLKAPLSSGRIEE